MPTGSDHDFRYTGRFALQRDYTWADPLLPSITHTLRCGSIGVSGAIKEIQRLRKINGQPIGSTAQIIRTLEIAVAKQMTPAERDKYCEKVRIGRTLKQRASGARAAAKLATGQVRLVDPATAQARAKICIGCPKNLRPKRSKLELAKDATMAALVARSNGGTHPTVAGSADVFFCDACGGCPMKSKIWLPQSMVQKDMKTPKDIEEFPSFCHQIQGLQVRQPLAAPGRKVKKSKRSGGCRSCGTGG